MYFRENTATKAAIYFSATSHDRSSIVSHVKPSVGGILDALEILGHLDVLVRSVQVGAWVGEAGQHTWNPNVPEEDPS